MPTPRQCRGHRHRARERRPAQTQRAMTACSIAGCNRRGSAEQAAPAHRAPAGRSADGRAARPGRRDLALSGASTARAGTCRRSGDRVREIVPVPPPPPRPPAATARVSRPVPLQAAPVGRRPPARAAQLAPRQEVVVRPAATGFRRGGDADRAALGYAPRHLLGGGGGDALAAIACGGGGRAGSTAATWPAPTSPRDNFREAVRDLETAVNQGGFELGT